MSRVALALMLAHHNRWHYQGSRQILFILFTTCVIAFFVYALIVEPIMDNRHNERQRQAEEREKLLKEPPPPPDRVNP